MVRDEFEKIGDRLAKKMEEDIIKKIAEDLAKKEIEKEPKQRANEINMKILRKNRGRF